MKLFFSFVIKEMHHILRDKRTMLILFGMPVVMMLLFGFAISTDVKNVRTVVVRSSLDEETQKLVDRLSANEYFILTDIVSTPAEAEQLIRHQQADMAVVFASDYAAKQALLTIASEAATVDGPLLQVITDGTDPNMAQQYAAYVSQILYSSAIPFSMQMLYNPQMRSCYNFVPGIMGVILILICALMTSISIAREKERGTMELLLVSPARPLLIVMAKVVPYLLLAFMILASILLISKFILAVPIAGGIVWIVLVAGIYIVVALSLGLLISTMARTQLVALLASAILLMLPSILLSGMMFPIESMPLPLQYVSALMPPRYFIAAMRKLMIMGVGIDKVVHEIVVLVGMAAFLLVMALRMFNKRLS